MDYKDVREKFVKLSGRYDLIKPNLTDDGADFFITAGQKILDRLFSSGKAKARYPSAIVAGTVKVAVTGLRAIKEVWVSDADGMTELIRESLNNIRNYYQEALSAVSQDRPSYYAPACFRPAPDTLTSATVSGYYDIEDLLLDSTHFTYDGIVIMPPADGTYHLTINGLFYSPTLSATLSGSTWTQTKSFWTEVHPDTLILAALYRLETFYRNREGAKDYYDAMMEDVRGIDYDIVETEIAGESIQMGG